MVVGGLVMKVCSNLVSCKTKSVLDGLLCRREKHWINVTNYAETLDDIVTFGHITKIQQGLYINIINHACTRQQWIISYVLCPT